MTHEFYTTRRGEVNVEAKYRCQRSHHLPVNSFINMDQGIKYLLWWLIEGKLRDTKMCHKTYPMAVVSVGKVDVECTYRDHILSLNT